MVNGRKRVERIPQAWVDEVRERVQAGRRFQDAERGVLAANAQLLALERRQRSRPQTSKIVSCVSAQSLLWFARRCLRLRRYLQSPGDGRQRPRIAAEAAIHE